MVNIFFQASALMHVIVTAVIYFTKQKEKTIENYVFRSLILCSIITLILDMISVVIGVHFNHQMTNEILGKIYLWGMMSWMIIYTYYLYVITHPKNSVRILMTENENTNMFITGMKRIMLFNLAVIILITAAPLFASVEGINFYTYGPSAIFSYIIGGTCLLSWIVLTIRNRKTIKKQHKRLIITSILISVCCLFVQVLKPEILLVSSVGAFLTTLAYFMLENPDLHYIEELNIATRQAENANHAKSDFLSSMSHEIRTPLNAIVGFSQALAKEDISGSAKDEVKEILNASTNLLETVNGILDISKIEANKIEIVKTDYSTKKVINKIINIANSKIGSKTLELIVEIDDKLPPVLYGDNTRLEQIILNLLTNSIKYTKTGYVKLIIDSQSTQDKTLLTIQVEDTGIGMTKEDIDMLFVKFQRFEMDKNINIAGTGLGMAIVKGLVELMNGDIAVDSEYGKGTTFTIILEQDISTKKLEEVATVEELQTIEPFNATGQRVLVVDDNKINLKVAEKMLSEYHVSMDLIDSGRECINKILSGEKYDLILLDIMMPKMKGPEVLKNLKAQVGFNTPVIALTADVISGMEDKYIKEGFDDCLPKPIVEEELFYLLKRYLKEVTDEGLLEHNYAPIETPIEVASPVVIEAVKPVEEPIELPTLAQPDSIELPAVAENSNIELPTIAEPTNNNLPALIETQQPTTSIQAEKVEKNQFERELDALLMGITITDDRFELIEKLKENKENIEEFGKLATQIKEIAIQTNLKDLEQIAYDHEIACKAEYQEFITENYDKLVNEIINNLDTIKKIINKE